MDDLIKSMFKASALIVMLSLVVMLATYLLGLI